MFSSIRYPFFNSNCDDYYISQNAFSLTTKIKQNNYEHLLNEINNNIGIKQRIFNLWQQASRGLPKHYYLGYTIKIKTHSHADAHTSMRCIVRYKLALQFTAEKELLWCCSAWRGPMASRVARLTIPGNLHRLSAESLHSLATPRYWCCCSLRNSAIVAKTSFPFPQIRHLRHCCYYQRVEPNQHCCHFFKE